MNVVNVSFCVCIACFYLTLALKFSFILVCVLDCVFYMNRNSILLADCSVCVYTLRYLIF
jgi:hypothetical protein